MTQWYYSDDARNRHGPHTAEELRTHYRQRRIRRDSLVWREGLSEWLPLERVAGELDLDSVVPDASLPPPLPSSGPAAPVYAARSAPPPKKGMSGCLIALIVCAVAVVPLTGILAAIAIPAYHDYVERAKKATAAPTYDAAKLAESDEQVRTLLRQAMGAYYSQHRQCPDAFEFESLQVRDPSLTGYFTVDFIDDSDNRCVYRVTFLQQGPMIDGKALRYEATQAADGSVSCSTSELTAEYRPPNCG
ncbi:MAG TPA: GYF domain-containing protein [Lysobacter sp.]|jgi:type IV pilus assembly protein PilA|nr:GYF domain-containing protein [Lysobacter sp.]